MLGNVSLIKLENPFAESKNLHWDNRPVCFKWACVLFSTFESDQSFVRVYDMRYEELSSPEIRANFGQIYPDIGYNLAEKDLVKTSEKDTLDLDLIPDNYTVRRIEILIGSKLQLVRFDELSSTNETLMLVMFYQNNKIEYYNLSREARLTANNLYFMSNWVNVTVRSSYNKLIKYRWTVIKFLEPDFYKYIFQVSIVRIWNHPDLLLLQVPS